MGATAIPTRYPSNNKGNKTEGHSPLEKPNLDLDHVSAHPSLPAISSEAKQILSIQPVTQKELASLAAGKKDKKEILESLYTRLYGSKIAAELTEQAQSPAYAGMANLQGAGTRGANAIYGAKAIATNNPSNVLYPKADSILAGAAFSQGASAGANDEQQLTRLTKALADSYNSQLSSLKHSIGTLPVKENVPKTNAAEKLRQIGYPNEVIDAGKSAKALERGLDAAANIPVVGAVYWAGTAVAHGFTPTGEKEINRKTRNIAKDHNLSKEQTEVVRGQIKTVFEGLYEGNIPLTDTVRASNESNLLVTKTAEKFADSKVSLDRSSVTVLAQATGTGEWAVMREYRKENAALPQAPAALPAANAPQGITPAIGPNAVKHPVEESISGLDSKLSSINQDDKLKGKKRRVALLEATSTAVSSMLKNYNDGQISADDLKSFDSQIGDLIKKHKLPQSTFMRSVSVESEIEALSGLRQIAQTVSANREALPKPTEPGVAQKDFDALCVNFRVVSQPKAKTGAAPICDHTGTIAKPVEGSLTLYGKRHYTAQANALATQLAIQGNLTPERIKQYGQVLASVQRWDN